MGILELVKTNRAKLGGYLVGSGSASNLGGCRLAFGREQGWLTSFLHSIGFTPFSLIFRLFGARSEGSLLKIPLWISLNNLLKCLVVEFECMEC